MKTTLTERFFPNGVLDHRLLFDGEKLCYIESYYPSGRLCFRGHYRTDSAANAIRGTSTNLYIGLWERDVWGENRIEQMYYLGI